MEYLAFTVLQKNERKYIRQTGSNLVIGDATVLAPKASASDIEVMGEFWAEPIKDQGLFQGYKYTPKELSATAPTYDSFITTHVKDKQSGDHFVIMVTLANYLADTTTATVAPVVVVEQTVCIDDAGEYVHHFAMPFQAAGEEVKAYVAIDGVLQDAPPAAGSADLTALVVWLNANIPEAGTWSDAGGKLKLVNTDGKSIGVTITAGNYV